MADNLLVRWSGLALLAALTTTAVGGRASAGQVLYLNGNYNTTQIDFKVNGVAYSETGGGVVGGSLNGVSVPYIYCLEWQLSVLVPGTYSNTPVTTNGTIHGHALPNGTGVTNAAADVAWLITQLAPSATSATSQAGLQALIWQEVTPGLTLNSTNQALVAAYTADKAALAAAQVGGLPNYEGSVLYMSPSTDGDVSNHNQALLGYNGNPPVATPEPATFAMALSGAATLAALAFVRRRRRVVIPAA